MVEELDGLGIEREIPEMLCVCVSVFKHCVCLFVCTFVCIDKEVSQMQPYHSNRGIQNVNEARMSLYTVIHNIQSN